MLYGVLCRLQRPAADYPTLSGAVQAVGVANWPYSDGVWLVESDRSIDEIRDSVAAAIEDDDVAMVFPLAVGPARWTNLRNARYGRQFLQGALAREQTPAAGASK